MVSLKTTNHTAFFLLFTLFILHSCELQAFESPQYTIDGGMTSTCSQPSDHPSLRPIVVTGGISQQELTVDAIFEVQSLCSSSSLTNPTLFAMTGSKPSLIRYWHLDYHPSTNQAVLQTQSFPGAPSTYSTIPLNLPATVPATIEFFGSISLSDGRYHAQVLTPDGRSLDEPMTRFYNGLLFDSSVRVYICADVLYGLGTLNCKIIMVKFWWTYIGPEKTLMYLYGVYPNLLGEYRMVDENPHMIVDSVGTLGNIPIESPGPTWDSDEKQGYQFTNSQGMKLVNFNHLNYISGYYEGSMSVSFWLKIKAAPTEINSLFKLCNDECDKNWFSLLVKPDLSIVAMIGENLSVESTQVMTAGSWRLITANFLAGSPHGFSSISIYFEGSQVGWLSGIPLQPYPAFDNTDTLVLGGYRTSYDWKIFSPGSHNVRAIESSTCRLRIGPERLNMCLWNLPCEDTPFCKDCVSGLCSSCAAGYKTAFSECNECPPGTYFLSNKPCQKCPTGCKTCNSDTDCTTCEQNYVSLSGLCSKLGCPLNPEYYLYTSDKICRPECPYPNLVITVSPTERLCSLDIDPDDYEQVKKLVNGAQAGGTTSGVVGLLMSLVDSANPSAFTMASITKMLQYMKFLRIGYPPKLYLMLLLQKTASGGLNFVPEMSDSIKENIPDKTLPMQFEIHKVHSCFLVGFWQPLISMHIIAGVAGMIYLIETHMQEYRKVHSIVTKISPHIKWNLFLTVFCSNYCDLAFYTAVSFISSNFESGVVVLGFLLCLGLNTLAFFLVVFMIQTIVSLRTARSHNSEDIVKKQYEKYKMIFEVFRDQTFLRQSFVIVFSIRSYLYSAIVGYLYNYPVVQAVLLLLLCIGMLIYLFVKRPMKLLINYIQQVFCELVLISVNLCVLIMSIIDTEDPVDNSKKDGYGAFVILMNILISWAMPVFSGIKVVVIIKEQLAVRKSKPVKLPSADFKIEGGDTLNLTTLQTNTAASSRKLPRIQMPNRPVPTLDNEISSYQINENETSIVELTKYSPNKVNY